MKKYSIILIVFILFQTLLPAQPGSNKHVIKGKVTDSLDGSVLAYANVILSHSIYGTTTNTSGEFVIKGVELENVLINVSYVGYERFSREIRIDGNSDTLYLNIELDKSPFRLSGCLVTSPKYTKNLVDVAMPMEVVTRTDIESAALTSAPDYLASQPGISLQRDGIWSSSVSIRGLSKNNIVMLVDGSRIETATNLAAGLSMIDVNDIKRIEVVKGAGSVLYGSGATGGIVNIITGSNEFTNNFSLHGSLASSYNTVNNGASGNLNLRASSDLWFVGLSSSLRSADDAVTGDGTKINSHFRDNNFSMRAGLKPYENQIVVFDYQRFKAEDVGIPGGAPFPDGASARYPSEERELYSVKYEITDLFELPAKFSLKYYNQRIKRDVELKPNQFAVSNPGADHFINGLLLQTDYVLNNSNLLIVGLDAWQREYDGLRTVTNYKLGKQVKDKPLPDSKFRSIGLFVQDEISVSQKVDLTIGARVDRIDVENEDVYSPVSVTTLETGTTVYPKNNLLWTAGKEDDLSWSVYLAMLYRISPKVDITINAAKSFRAPSLEERYQYIELGGAAYWGDPDLASEDGWFFDAGMRYNSNSISLRVNGFVNSLKNLVIDKMVNDTKYMKDNVGHSLLYGGEFHLDYNAFRNLVVNFNASYVRGRDTHEDEDLPQMPPLNGTVGVTYSFNKNLSANLSTSFFTKQSNTAEGEAETPGYVLLDASAKFAGLDLGLCNINLYAGVENILDKTYKNHLSTYRGLIKLEPGRNVFFKTVINL